MTKYNEQSFRKEHQDISHDCTTKKPNFESKRALRLAWEQTFKSDPINLKELPKNVVLKAREIIQALASHKDYRNFHGKRLRHDRFVVSIPVTRNYRLLCRDNGGYLIPETVVSHADYNICKPGG